jgi:hypothetical protein
MFMQVALILTSKQAEKPASLLKLRGRESGNVMSSGHGDTFLGPE